MNYWLQRIGMAVLLLLCGQRADVRRHERARRSAVQPARSRWPATRRTRRACERIAAAKAEYHLDDPLPVRYVKWLGDFVTGDFGVQFSTDGEPPVADLIKERAPRTMMLLVMAQTLAARHLDPVGAVGGVESQQARRQRVDVGDVHADRPADLRAGRDPQVHLRDQVGLVPAALRRHRHRCSTRLIR